MPENGSVIDLHMSESISDVTLPRLKAFIPQLLSRLHIEALLHGNITKQVGLKPVTVDCMYEEVRRMR